MIIKDIIHEDFINYRKCSMSIAMPYCNGKCWKEQGLPLDICHNNHLNQQENKEISSQTIVNWYINNPLTEAILFGGLEPFDSFEEMLNFIEYFRKYSNDDIVVYTGYYYHEIEDKINELKKHKNIIVKFGRYIPNSDKRYDEILGVFLASVNQYAERIS